MNNNKTINNIKLSVLEYFYDIMLSEVQKIKR